MKPVAFDYERARDISHASTLLGDTEDAKILAGGQSLGPMLNLRLARPRLLVDIRGIEALQAVEETPGSVLFGAAVTHAQIEDGAVPDPSGGMMRRVAAGIAYRAVRNRGTIGGSLSHADPAADWIAVMWALAARIHIAGPEGTRQVPATGFLRGAFSTALADGEIVTHVEVPRLSSAARWGFYKFCRKVGEFGEAIGAVVVDPEREVCRVVSGGADQIPLYLTDTARALARHGQSEALTALRDEIVRCMVQSDPVDQRLREIAVARAIAKIFEP